MVTARALAFRRMAVGIASAVFALMAFATPAAMGQYEFSSWTVENSALPVASQLSCALPLGRFSAVVGGCSDDACLQWSTEITLFGTSAPYPMYSPWLYQRSDWNLTSISPSSPVPTPVRKLTTARLKYPIAGLATTTVIGDSAYVVGMCSLAPDNATMTLADFVARMGPAYFRRIQRIRLVPSPLLGGAGTTVGPGSYSSNFVTNGSTTLAGKGPRQMGLKRSHKHGHSVDASPTVTPGLPGDVTPFLDVDGDYMLISTTEFSGRVNASCVALGGLVYVVGGVDIVKGVPSQSIGVFNPVTGTYHDGGGGTLKAGVITPAVTSDDSLIIIAEVPSLNVYVLSTGGVTFVTAGAPNNGLGRVRLPVASLVAGRLAFYGGQFSVAEFYNVYDKISGWAVVNPADVLPKTNAGFYAATHGSSTALHQFGGMSIDSLEARTSVDRATMKIGQPFPLFFATGYFLGSQSSEVPYPDGSGSSSSSLSLSGESDVIPGSTPAPTTTKSPTSASNAGGLPALFPNDVIPYDLELAGSLGRPLTSQQYYPVFFNETFVIYLSAADDSSKFPFFTTCTPNQTATQCLIRLSSSPRCDNRLYPDLNIAPNVTMRTGVLLSTPSEGGFMEAVELGPFHLTPSWFPSTAASEGNATNLSSTFTFVFVCVSFGQVPWVTPEPTSNGFVALNAEAPFELVHRPRPPPVTLAPLPPVTPEPTEKPTVTPAPRPPEPTPRNGLGAGAIVGICVAVIVFTGGCFFAWHRFIHSKAPDDGKMLQLAQSHGAESLLSQGLIHGKYRLLEKLGRGSFSVVYLVQRVADKQRFALKHVLCESDADRLEAMKECEVVRQLQSHHNVVRLVDMFLSCDFDAANKGQSSQSSSPAGSLLSKRPVYHDGPIVDDVGAEYARRPGAARDGFGGAPGYLALVMEYHERGDLGRWVRERKHERIPEATVVSVAFQVCSVLHFMHTRSPPILHRDLKPENLLLTSVEYNNVSSEFLPIVVTDFGLSRVMDKAFCETGVGSLPYVAPECWRRNYSTKVDIWALGCIIFAICTRRVEPANVVVMFSESARRDFDAFVRHVLVVEEGYSKELANFVLMMLRVDQNLRPTAEMCLSCVAKRPVLRPSMSTSVAAEPGRSPSRGAARTTRTNNNNGGLFSRLRNLRGSSSSGSSAGHPDCTVDSAAVLSMGTALHSFMEGAALPVGAVYEYYLTDIATQKREASPRRPLAESGSALRGAMVNGGGSPVGGPSIAASSTNTVLVSTSLAGGSRSGESETNKPRAALNPLVNPPHGAQAQTARATSTPTQQQQQQQRVSMAQAQQGVSIATGASVATTGDGAVSTGSANAGRVATFDRFNPPLGASPIRDVASGMLPPGNHNGARNPMSAIEMRTPRVGVSDDQEPSLHEIEFPRDDCGVGAAACGGANGSSSGKLGSGSSTSNKQLDVYECPLLADD